MSRLSELLDEFKDQMFDDTNIEVLPYNKDKKEVKVILNNFHTYHVDILKKYPCKYDPIACSWVVNIWVALDIVIPKLKVPSSNTFIHPAILREKEYIEKDVKVMTRVSSEDLTEVPALKGKEPYETFQQDAILAILRKNFYGVFFKQGMGKSFVIASAIRKLTKQNNAYIHIIVTPSTGLYDIKRKILTFAKDTFTDEDFLIVNKDNRDCFNQDTKTYKIFVMTYNTLRLVYNYYTKAKPVSRNFEYKFKKWLDDTPFSYTVDEGHYVSKYSAQQTKANLKIAKLADTRIMSTGTPVDKGENYYSILKFIHPFFVRYLTNSDWLKCIADIGTDFSEFALAQIRSEDLRYFVESASSHYINLHDDDVLDLPPHYVKEIPIRLEKGKQLTIFELFSTLQLKRMKKEKGFITLKNVLNNFPYLLLALDNPLILLDNTSTWLPSNPGDYAEVDKLMRAINSFNFEKDFFLLPYLYEILNDHPNDKFVIWSTHPKTLDALIPLLKKYNNNRKPLCVHGKVKIKGKTTEQVKDSIVREYVSNPDQRILLASPLVLETAVDIVEATKQFYIDLPYRHAYYDQSRKRLHRYGQENPVTTYLPYIEQTLSETRLKLIKSKQQLDRKGLDVSLSLDEWKKLFTGGLPDILSTESAIKEGWDSF